ncbi:MAG: permease [Bacillota bacterium]|nr:permease [Bacillota bacterium]
MSPGGRLGTKLARLRPYALLILTLVGDLALGVVRPGLGWQAVRTSASYLLEMLLVLPPIFVLIGMLEVWVPRQTIVRNVGPGSGLRGLALSVLTGSAAAGPLYGAFPVAESLLRKGCSVFNACVLLCTWAAVKIPMIMMEVKFLGWRFSLARLAFTLPAIVLISWLVDRFTPRLGGLCGEDRPGVGREMPR